MKKLVIALICLSLSGVTLAEKVRLINADQTNDSMVVKYQFCTHNNQSKVDCSSNSEVSVTLLNALMGQNYIDVQLPSSQNPNETIFLNIMSADSHARTSAHSQYQTGQCEADQQGDVIILNTYSTDKVVCDNRGKI